MQKIQKVLKIYDMFQIYILHFFFYMIFSYINQGLHVLSFTLILVYRYFHYINQYLHACTFQYYSSLEVLPFNLFFFLYFFIYPSVGFFSKKKNTSCKRKIIWFSLKILNRKLTLIFFLIV